MMQMLALLSLRWASLLLINAGKVYFYKDMDVPSGTLHQAKDAIAHDWKNTFGKLRASPYLAHDHRQGEQ